MRRAMPCFSTNLESAASLLSMPWLHRLPLYSSLLLSPPEYGSFLRHRRLLSSPCRASSSNSSFDDQFCFPSTSQPNLCSFVTSFTPTPSTDPSSPSPRFHGSLVYQDLQQSISLLEPPSRTFDAPSTIGSSHHGGRGKPMSLKMLKRKMQPRIMVRFQKEKLQELMRKMESGHDEAYDDFGDAVSTAFASLICMMKMLLRRNLELRTNLIDQSNTSLQEAAQKVQEEMQESLLWLFQQVFCCTPKLMLLLMVLLADFTVYSMSRHAAVSAGPSVSKKLGDVGRIRSDLDLKGMSVSSQSKFKGGVSESESLCIAESVTECSCIQEEIVGENLEQPQRDQNLSQVNVDEIIDNEWQWPRLCTKECDNASDNGILSSLSSRGSSSLQPDMGVHSHGDKNAEESTRIIERLMQEAMSNELKLKLKSLGQYKLNWNARQMLVAPVIAPKLEPDDYACYDRTDLNYQYEIMMDPENPLLLSNYAQFMHLVRHDNYRAEELFRRAVRADPVDGEVMARLASFLWVAKGDLEGADRAYKAAVSADPSNSFHAGCYAHFLWNSGQGENTTVPNSLSKPVTSA